MRSLALFVVRWLVLRHSGFETDDGEVPVPWTAGSIVLSGATIDDDVLHAAEDAVTRPTGW